MTSHPVTKEEHCPVCNEEPMEKPKCNHGDRMKRYVITEERLQKWQECCYCIIDIADEVRENPLEAELQKERGRVLDAIPFGDWLSINNAKIRTAALNDAIKEIKEVIEYEDYCIKQCDNQINRTQRAILMQVVEKLESQRGKHE